MRFASNAFIKTKRLTLRYIKKEDVKKKSTTTIDI